MTEVTVVFHTNKDMTDDEWEDAVEEALTDAGHDVTVVEVSQEEV